jgi:hypothetical protein
MRLSTLVLFTFLFLVAGCSQDVPPAGRPAPARLEALVIRGENHPVGFLQSDRRGAILYATEARLPSTMRWNINGSVVLEGMPLSFGGTPLGAVRPDSVLIYPERLRLRVKENSVEVSVVETGDLPGRHAIEVSVAGPGVSTAVLAVPASTRGARLSCRTVDSTAGGIRWVIAAGPESRGGLTSAELDSLSRGRIRRMEALLDSSFISIPEDTINLALQWAKLMLDALVVEGTDTIAIGELPWDGGYDIRANVQSIAALGMLGDGFSRAGGVIRSIARHADNNPKSPTYGRIADRVKGAKATYAGADVAPWFAWEMYQHVTRCDDTAMARSMFPWVVRSIDAARRSHVDGKGLLLHGPHETWMSAVPRGNRAVELQLFWYFHQLVGSYIGSFVGDSVRAQEYWDSSVLTSNAFTSLFEDTTRSSLPDNLRPDDTPDTTVRANALLCLEMAENVGMRVKTTRTSVEKLLTPEGVRGYEGGPIWTWLTGPEIYAVTRIDRPDLARIILHAMARRMLTSGIAGTLPEQIGAPGPVVSLRGTAEFIRTVNQEVLGIRVDLAAGSMTISPKLPDGWSDVGFSAAVGASHVIGTYRRAPDADRISFRAAPLPRPMRIGYMWILANGDAWRGGISLHEATSLDLVMRGEEIVAFQGDKEGVPESKRLLRHFSQRDVMNDVRMGGDR